MPPRSATSGRAPPGRLRHEEIQVPDIVRTRHDLFARITGRQLEINDPLFLKSFREITPADYNVHQRYVDALGEHEENHRVLLDRQQRAQREQQRALLAHRLGLDYNENTVAHFLRLLPANVFMVGADRVPDATLQRIVINVMADLPNLDVLAEVRRLSNILYVEQVEPEVAVDDTPEFLITPQRLLVVNQAHTEFYPFRYIYVRPCYEILLPKILATARDTVVALIGDPGIGKSTFLRYCFANVIAATEPRQRVFWEMESGHWRYFDGVNRHSGSGDSTYWMSPDVLLLIDGAYQRKHLAKTKNVVLFCSPQHQNYERMVKAASGAIFIMPCWEFNEVREFIDINIVEPDNTTRNMLDITMFRFYNRLFEETEARRPVATNVTVPFVEYNEYDAVTVLEKITFLKREVLNRFELVGGRIRILLHNEIGFSQLKTQVLKSIYAVSVDVLKQLDSLDLHSQAPSVLYSFSPVDLNLRDPRNYRLCFASRFIANHVASRIVLDFGEHANRLFAAMKDQKVGSSLVGQLFESLFIGALRTGKIVRLEGKRLMNRVGQQMIINFSDFDVVKYESNHPNLSVHIANLRTNRLLIPRQMNAHSVDAVFFQARPRKLYFIQVTISLEHPFKYSHLTSLATSFHVPARNVEYVFVVPSTTYPMFKRQKAYRDKNVLLRNDSYIGFNQSVMSVQDIENDNASILNLVASV